MASVSVANAENIYWVFSASAQTVSAMVAFLVAGYALVHTIMETAVQRDETLAEITQQLKREYYGQLAILAVATALAIITSLLTVYLNATPPKWFRLLLGISSLLVIISVAGSVYFVIRIVDPAKYQKTAGKLAAGIRPKSTESAMLSAAFFGAFVALEQQLRRFWESRTGGTRVSRLFRVSLSETVSSPKLEDTPRYNQYPKGVSREQATWAREDRSRDQASDAPQVLL